MNLGKYIQQLLLDNEMVIVPGFGAFISEYKPAELHDASDELSPPSTQIIFNSQIRNNDGLLVGFVAENCRCSHFDALQRIEKERDNIVYQLDKGEKVELEELGTLSYNSEQEIVFTAWDDKNISLESFGLETVTLVEEEPEPLQTESSVITEEKDISENKPIEPEQKKETLEKESEKQDEVAAIETHPYIPEDKNEKKRKKGWLWFLALIPLIAVCVFILLKGMEDGKSDKNQNTLPEVITHQEPAVTTKMDSVTQDSVKIMVEDTTKQETAQQPVSTKQDTSAGKYYLISGSFSVEKNAETYITELKEKGVKAFNAGKKGRFFCVGIGIFSTFDEAEKAKIEFMNNNPGSEGWVWKK